MVILTMTVYIKDFCFKHFLKKNYISFKYFTGYKWKKIKTQHEFQKENVTMYTRLVLDSIIKDVCGTETDPVKRDFLLRKFESDVTCVVQLNTSVIKDATKIFS